MPSLDPALGGTQSGGASMILAAQRAGIDNVVAVPDRENTSWRSRGLIELLRGAGVRVETFAPLNRPAAVADRWSMSYEQARWIVGHLRESDILHVHGVWGVGQLLGMLSSRLTGLPRVVTAHESLTAFDINDSRSTARRRQKLVLKSAYLRWTTLFVLTSQLEARDSLPSRSACRTVPYPLFDESKPLPRLHPRGLRRELHVGYVGRIDPKKNLDLLIRAVAEMPKHVHLSIAGDGPADLVREFRSLARACGVEDRLRWLGFIDREQRDLLLDQIDLLVMPSAFESFGMSAAEAMLLGVPVVVSDRTGVSELIRRHGGGLIVEPSQNAIAAGIGQADEDRPMLGALGAAGQDAIRAELGYARIGRLMLDAYLEAIGASPD